MRPMLHISMGTPTTVRLREGGMGDGRREPRQVEPAAALVAEFGADYADAFGVASPATATALAARCLTAAHHSLG
jgi:hypothetical protein